MKILLVLAVLVGIVMVVKNNSKKMLVPVTRQVVFSDDKMKKTTILHFGKPTKSVSMTEISDSKFFVKLKGNSLFCGKTIIRVDDLEEGTTRYDDNGYKVMLTRKEMETAFEHASRVAPTY